MSSNVLVAHAEASSALFPGIRKRNNQFVPFKAEKITAAIAKAGEATGEFGITEARRLTARALQMAQEILGEEIPEVESIQDIVEETLLFSPYKKTAKAYILYRESRAQQREIINKADIQLVNNYLDRLDWQVEENSNMAYSLQGLNNYVANEVSKKYWLNKIYTKEIREAHQNGDLHIHDLGLLSVYCVGWDLQDLL